MWFFILILLGITAYLWQRLDRAERRLDALDTAQNWTLQYLQRLETPETAHNAEPEPIAEDKAQDETVEAPAVALRASEADDAVTLVSADPPQEQPTEVEPQLEPEPEPEPRGWNFDLEDIFGRRLPIWAGGVTLAVAGVFLVRYSIERGLVTPLLRVIMAFAFGFSLLAGAELAYRQEARVADPRVRQALAGAGLATLYAAFYLAGTQYGLIGQSLAFLGLAGVTAAAIALSFRFGLPSAVLGLVGGFAAPALVGGEEANLPLLALYLGLVTAGLAFSGRRQQRPWMGIAALIGGLGWGTLLLLAGDPGFAEMLALGLYFIVLGAVLPAMLGQQEFERPVRLAAALVSSVQLALLVDQGGYTAMAWGLYLILGATLAWFAWRRPELREANAAAAIVGILLLAQWDGAAPLGFAAVAAALAGLFAAVPLALIWRREDRAFDLWQLCGTAVGLAVVSYATLAKSDGDMFEPVLALATFALAAFPALAAWRIWSRDEPRQLAIALGSTAALVFAALLMITPAWSAPLAAAAVFGGLFALLRQRSSPELAALLWFAAVITGLSLFSSLTLVQEAENLAQIDDRTTSVKGLLRWTAAALPFVAMAWRNSSDPQRRVAEGLGTALIYGALAQVLPGAVLAWTAATLAIGLVITQPARIAAQMVAAAITCLWALPPTVIWLTAAILSLAGGPVFIGELPLMRSVLLHILPAGAALLAVATVRSVKTDVPMVAGALAGLVTLIAAHVAFKQLFAIETFTRFITQGLLERTLWEALLMAAAWAANRDLPRLGKQRTEAIGLATAALAHFTLYSGLLHNPLWAEQAVGPVPVANLAAAAYGVAIAAALLLRNWLGKHARLPADAAVMVLVSLLAITLLRQAFAGSVMAGVPLGQTEDLLRSLTGILLALGFLFVGSRLARRSWRVGSLVVMLIAVVKVFIFDAAGLEGLLRVVSFMALGFSLIGIGWLYSRQLRALPREADTSNN
ncbi:DUF2339 domain-containing protein [Qipengyuania marisflavi]|uniref:DUF2339 domain-containing protein n=1 Tax=Qipengyuania marisflavi TaxID=2486356 RepID=A0A5S3P3A8_9SPHN|nr:DUF2339 domain-containing protein [Qipengyuania marisflavi]TMM47336.1 DUF2339 domain-containing protein [Qipengyuania marisflavi]